MQKFVITSDGELRFGDVHLHRHLLPWGDDTCFGGGFWLFHQGNPFITLYGQSFDYGAPDFSHVVTIDWSGIDGTSHPLLYFPHYPDTDFPEQVLPQ